MKKTALFAIVCLAMVLTSCHKPQEFYNASITESHFASNDNENSVNAILGTITNYWNGDYAFSGMTADMSDFKAINRYEESSLAILFHSQELEPYFEEGDYFIYTLKRTTGGEEVVLLQTKFFLNADGKLDSEEHNFVNGD